MNPAEITSSRAAWQEEASGGQASPGSSAAAGTGHSRSNVLLGKERGSSSDLPPTARGILDAARSLLVERGYRGLTFDAIAAESGSNKSMIRYYFGSKDGLIAALVDDLTHDSAVELLEIAKKAQGAEDALTAHLQATRKLMEDPSFKSLFDIVPEAMRRGYVRESLASLYGWYREIEAECFRNTTPKGNPDLRVLASLHMAVIDGLALQLALDEKSVDLDACWGLMGSMIAAHLSGTLQAAPKGSEGP